MYSSYLRTKYSYMILTYNRLNFKQKHTNEGKKIWSYRHIDHRLSFQPTRCVSGVIVTLFEPYICKAMLNLPFPHLSITYILWKTFAHSMKMNNFLLATILFVVLLEPSPHSVTYPDWTLDKHFLYFSSKDRPRY